MRTRGADELVHVLSIKLFKILLEILVRGKYERIKEVPYTFRERQKGKTKLGLTEYAKYLKLLCSLYLVRLKGIFAGSRAE